MCWAEEHELPDVVVREISEESGAGALVRQRQPVRHTYTVTGQQLDSNGNPLGNPGVIDFVTAS
jgi:hypothetical protein